MLLLQGHYGDQASADEWTTLVQQRRAWKIQEEKMTKYKFEIQTLITVEVEAVNKDDARCMVSDNFRDGFYDDEMHSDPCVSDGEEIEP